MAHTNTAIAILERRVEKDAISIDPAAEKSITLRLSNATVATTGFEILSTVTFEAELGNGGKRVFRVRNNSTSAGRALDGAAFRGVKELLSDEQFLAYMNGR